MGIPLMGDELYGGTKDMALSVLRPRTPSVCHFQLNDLLTNVERPCLHAMVLGWDINALSQIYTAIAKFIALQLPFCRFEHPWTGKYMHFSCPPPVDFAEVLNRLRHISRLEGAWISNQLHRSDTTRCWYLMLNCSYKGQARAHWTLGPAQVETKLTLKALN